MTDQRRVGILANASFKPFGERVREWAFVAWGTDSPADARVRVARAEVDVVLVEASVEFLSDAFLSAAAGARVDIVIFDSSGAHSEWLKTKADLSVVRSIDEFRNVLESTSRRGPTAHRPMVVAVWGPPGAPGVTTTAISLSALAATERRGVMLCDADTRGASISIALGLLDDVPGFAAASRLAGRNELTGSEIDRLAISAGRGKATFSVLTGLPRSSRWSEIAPAKSTVVIDALTGLCDVVVVDVGSSIEENDWIDNAPQRDGAAREIIRRADTVVAVGNSDAVGIARLIRGLDELRDISENPHVVLNRVTRASAIEARAAVERFSSHSITATVSRDGRGGVDDALSKASAFAAVWDAVKSVEV